MIGNKLADKATAAQPLSSSPFISISLDPPSDDALYSMKFQNLVILLTQKGTSVELP